MIKREDIYYESRDGVTRIHGVQWIPRKGEIKGILQIVHGMVEHIQRYDAFARYMAEQGFVVVGNDHLGHGASVISEEQRGYFCTKDATTVLVRDVHRLKKITQKSYPGKPYFVLGHSMGSFIVRKYMVEYGKGIDGVILMGTGWKEDSLLKIGITLTETLSRLKGETYRSKLINSKAFASFNKEFEPARTEHDWLTKDAAKVDEYEQDKRNDFVFSLNAYHALFQLILYVQQEENYTSGVKTIPILILSGEKDPVGDNGEGVKLVYELYKKAGYSNVQMKLYPNDRHELLNELDKEQVYQDIQQWIWEQLSKME